MSPIFEMTIQDQGMHISLQLPIKVPEKSDLGMSVISDSGAANAVCQCAIRDGLSNVLFYAICASWRIRHVLGQKRMGVTSAALGSSGGGATRVHNLLILENMRAYEIIMDYSIF